MELDKVYCMDNLELLKQLPNESVDLIYNDILYNTGNKFKDYDIGYVHIDITTILLSSLYKG